MAESTGEYRFHPQQRRFLSDTGNYRIDFDLTANMKIHKWLTWNLGLSDRYLTNPPTGIKPNDILYTTGLGVTFGH